jgi:hypothetical protein
MSYPISYPIHTINFKQNPPFTDTIGFIDQIDNMTSMPCIIILQRGMDEIIFELNKVQCNEISGIRYTTFNYIEGSTGVPTHYLYRCNYNNHTYETYYRLEEISINNT